MVAWARLGQSFGGSMQRVTVNGGPGALVRDSDGGLLAVWALDVADGAIRGVASIVNPDKLRHIATVGSMRDALASVRGRGSS